MRNDPDKYDYISRPKQDGYRGIHDIYEYAVNSETGTAYNGLLIELQYRTIYQHAWATSVEIVGMLTVNQPKFHAGDDRHIEFFRLASEIIARVYEDRTSAYPDMSNTDLVHNFVQLEDEIRVLRLLKNLDTSAQKTGGRKNVILSFSSQGELELFSYAKGADAIRKYFQLEQLQSGADVVLVKGATAKDIRMAYKNYFSDPNDFVKYIEHGCRRLIRPRTRVRRRGN